jgi:hypothetical protein
MDFNQLGLNDLPLVGGLCLIQQTSTIMGLIICPSSEDFVITVYFDQLGCHELPLIGGLCQVQRTLTS